MTVQDYLLKFRKINSLESLEKLFDHLNYTLSDNQEIINMYRAADHRRAELVSGGRLFNVGEVPKSVWRYVLYESSHPREMLYTLRPANWLYNISRRLWESS